VRPAAAFDLPRGVVVPVRDIDLRLLPGDHPFAERSRAAALANWQREVAAKPALFDGRITLFASMHIADGVLSGAFHMTDYSSFLHWRRMRGAREGEHAYAHAVIVARDGDLLAVRMGNHTANAGRVYFASGSFEPQDVREGRIDVEANMAREVAEETGLRLADMQPEAGYHIYSVESGTVVVRRYHSDRPAGELAEAVRAHVASQADPELEGPVILSSGSGSNEDFADQMHAIVDWHFGRRTEL